MARTESTMLPLGTTAPAFSLPDVVSGNAISLDTFDSAKALLVIFASPHCPFVQHVKYELAQLDRDFSEQGLAIAGISSNDVEKYPDDSPEKIKAFAQEVNLSFPFLYDESQEVAKAYQAACTPDFFLFDGDRRLVYRGQLDDSRPGNQIPVTGQDLRQAIAAVLAGQPVATEQKPSIGCNIKWKPGNEPAYYGGAPTVATKS
ncbi:thioredoxin family protein [Oscillatoria sp. FACHB-1407]|uniref:thioredoxin family protein n=1 Tax=Oscillatoria sp. FACHB-1407 TaxID=2692847 RepID=UPI001686BF1E|nr:thioredoxin family protein [Oscillatoria sp. FACHB-1407]MBD2464253.1 thioredoxin family protein [Oscillatoria sp. FACHB-1407]